jgi:hypothetical protein
LIFDKEAKPYTDGRTASSTNCVGKNWLFTCRRLKLDPCLAPVKKSTPDESKILMLDLKF